jgi:hypothetical protein
LGVVPVFRLPNCGIYSNKIDGGEDGLCLPTDAKLSGYIVVEIIQSHIAGAVASMTEGEPAGTEMKEFPMSCLG